MKRISLAVGAVLLLAVSMLAMFSPATLAQAPATVNSLVRSWNGTSWDPMSGLLVGTTDAPASDVVTVQAPIRSGIAGYPTAATPIQGNAAGTTGAVVGTLAGVASKTTYICDFDVSAIGGTAAVGPITVAGLLGGSKVYQLSSSAAGVIFSKSFNPCLPASAVNTAITITTTADGTATAVDVNSSGFQQ